MDAGLEARRRGAVDDGGPVLRLLLSAAGAQSQAGLGHALLLLQGGYDLPRRGRPVAAPGERGGGRDQLGVRRVEGVRVVVAIFVRL